MAWDYMSATLQTLGFPTLFIRMILALYSSPTARIRVNGRLSEAFSVSNGTRQGCPLSPLIFILTLEPLLRKIRANPDIKEIDINSKQYKIASFNILSNFKINFTKSKALNISLPQRLVMQCKMNFPFKWEPHALTYLGIQLPTHLDDLYDRNYLPIFANIQKDLLKWTSGHFSWFGRIAIIKMNILPRILYLLQTVPIKLPASFFTTYKKICRNFIWAAKSPRLSWEKMTTPKIKGGLSLPDIHKYHSACHLTRIIDWHIHKSTKDWVDLEDSFAPVPIAHLPWINSQATPKEYTSHPLMGPTLTTFRQISQTLHWCPSPGPLTPLVDNPDFEPGVPSHNQPHTQIITPLRTSQFFQNGKLLPFNALLSHLPDYHIPFFKFLQIRHFLNEARPTSQWFRDLTPFETLCTSSLPQKHLISEVYSLLFSEYDPKINTTNQKWETELGLDISYEDWVNINL